MFREQSPINNTVFWSFYTDMEARLHFESNFSGTLFRLKTTFFVQTLYLWKSRSKYIGLLTLDKIFFSQLTKINENKKDPKLNTKFVLHSILQT